MNEFGRRPSRVVGILGGMGPTATVDFYAKLTENTSADRDQDHLRVVIWSDPTVPSRQEAILSDGTDPTPWLQRGFDTLVASGAEVLVVPCNTVSPFLAEIVPDGAEFIDIVDVTIKAVQRVATSKSIGLLATDAALAVGMYQSALTTAGFEPQVPDTSSQQRLTAIVGRVKTIGADSIASEDFVDLLDTFRASGIDTVIVGCTELSAVLAVCEPPPGLRLIDPAQELATTAIAAARDDDRQAHRTGDFNALKQRLPEVDLDFTGQEPIPPSATRRVQELLRSGKLFRYGETGAGEDDASALEAEFAAVVGRKYCVAFNSCGAAMAAALIAAGVQRDEPVLMNAFTLAPVPGAITHAGARPALVGITADYCIDIGDLRRAAEETNARWLLLSYMRGHIPNLDELVATCGELGINLIEDCAHTMGARWDGRSTGTFGVAGCFSSQSFKHVNSGEGGLLVTDDDDVAATAVLLSGSYMFYDQHGARPPAEAFDRHRLQTPNLSMRMSALSAALLRPQLELLPGRIRTWNERYSQLAGLLAEVPGVRLPVRPPTEEFVGSSIQFDLAHDDRAGVVRAAADRGVPLKWFGAEEPHGFTSRFDHWEYIDDIALDATRAVLKGLIDMRIPLSMTAQQAEDVVAVIRHAVAHPLQP